MNTKEKIKELEQHLLKVKELVEELPELEILTIKLDFLDTKKENKIRVNMFESLDEVSKATEKEIRRTATDDTGYYEKYINNKGIKWMTSDIETKQTIKELLSR